MVLTVKNPGRDEGRIASIDLLRGIVMILMLLDHIRTFWNSGTGIDPMDIARTNPALFFTRWATHPCAPAFVLLAGTSAYLSNRNRGRDRTARTSLCLRGAVLILLELIIVSPCWGYAFFLNGIFLQVIWVLGVSLIFLGALRPLPPRATGVLGLAMIAGHNLLPDPGFTGTLPAAAWSVLHERAVIRFSGNWRLEVLYPLVPWIGVAAFGYALGELYELEPKTRKRILAGLGTLSILLFCVLRAFNLYGDPSEFLRYESAIRTFFSFLNLEKYPPSLQFLLATSGPAFLLLSFLERFRPNGKNPLVVFGRTPLFFYVVHLFLLILATAGAVILLNVLGILRSYEVEGPFGFDLWVTYLLWPIFLSVLYPACRWYYVLKFDKKRVWTRYF